MGRDIKGKSVTEWKKVMELCIILMETYIQVNGHKIVNKVKDKLSILMGAVIRVSGKKINDMDKVLILKVE